MVAMTLVSIETTQAIQTFPPTVPLVAHKPTVVRVTLRHNLGPGANPTARARLRVKMASGAVSGWFDASNDTGGSGDFPRHSITLKSAPDREITDDSFNFRVPLALCSGTVQWEFEARIDAKSLPASLRNDDLQLGGISGPTEFRPRRRFEVRYVRVEWPVPTASGAKVNVLPSEELCASVLRDASQLIPSPPPLVDSAYGLCLAVDLTKEPEAVYDLLKRVMFFHEELDPAGGGVQQASDRFWFGIYDFPDYALKGMAPYGGRNVLAAAERVTVAHEWAHALNQTHLIAQCPTFGPITGEPSYQFAGGPRITDTPFDVDRNAVPSRSPGKERWDLMTYCIGDNWVSAQRWQRLWAQVGAP